MTEIEIFLTKYVTGIILIKGNSRFVSLFHVKREEMKIESLCDAC